ncbi:hypothetical protein E2C01_089503 [Portunus trituberculatus]|uniref:Uncharacterized protein n=1 Tax=Portunus trituberculatus TaxID=210409 RepID=A0A5B7JHE7_PORTR|nr:hypothetical protein [Portunus trituberculatus]
MREGVRYRTPALEGLGEKLGYTQWPQSHRKRTAQTLSLHKTLALHDTHCGSTVTARKFANTLHNTATALTFSVTVTVNDGTVTVQTLCHCHCHRHCMSTGTVQGVAALHLKNLVRRDNWQCLGGGGGPMAAGGNQSQGGVPKNYVTIGSCYFTAPCGLWIWSIHGAASLRGGRNRPDNCSRFCILLKVTERGVEPTDQDMWGSSSLCAVAASSVRCCMYA